MSDNVLFSNAVGPAGQGRYAPVNGIELYYETYGAQAAGTPLVLLHGGFGTVGMFAELLPELSHGRPVIAVELQAHGHTADVDRPLRFETLADDVAALIGALGLEKADLMGYSLGGGVALQTAIRHPEVVRKLVLVSTPGKREGWYPEVLAGMSALSAEAAGSMVGSPMHQAYASVAPRPEDWPLLAEKEGELLRQPYDWTAQVARLQMPTLIAAGDADAVRTAHLVELYQLLGGGQGDPGWDGARMPRARLAILPGVTHYNIVNVPLLAAVVIPFLDEPLPKGE